MGSITSIKCVLTQEHLDAICAKYFVPEEVHPQLPSSDATMHERPAGKVGMYTRFFELSPTIVIPFSTFFVSVLTHFRIPFTQLSGLICQFVVPANARFKWFSGSNIVKDRAPAPSEYNVEHVNALIAQASPFLRFPEEFLCWVGISRNYLLNKDSYPRFEYEDGEVMDLNAFIRTADPRKVRVVERPRAENEGPIVTVANVEREFVGDASGGARNQSFDSPFGHGTACRSHPPKRLRIHRLLAGTAGGSVTGGKSLSALNSFSSWRRAKDRANSAGPEVDSLVRSTAPIMTEAITVATTVAIPADISKDKGTPRPSVFGSSSSSEKTDRTLSLFTGRSGSGFDAGSSGARNCPLEHEQLFTEFNVSTARNLSLSSEVRMRAEYNILEKRKWRTLAEEKNTLLEARDKEIEDLKSQLLRAREESAEVTQLRAQVSGLEATENSLRGEVASAKDRNTLLEQECDSLKLKVTGLESAIVDKI
ncbi:hypothetical protein Tco_0783856 [Tanacetum coccineum]